MTDFGLKLRMVLVGTILFAFYLGAATVLSVMFNLPLIPVLLAGIIILPVIQYKLGKWMATRKAKPMPTDGQYRDIHHLTEELAREMDVPNPKLMVMDMGVPNAFAVGRKNAGVVVVSNELIRVLDRDELRGVIAHELAHIKNRDVITMVVGQSIGMIVGYVAYFAVLFGGERNIGTYVLAIAASSLANMFVMIFVLAISRYREYVADDDAKTVIGTGDPLARALEKISTASSGREPQMNDNLSALCIFNAEKGLFQRLFSTHPPTEERIERLRAI